MTPGKAVSKRERGDYADALMGLACGLVAVTAFLFVPSILSHAPGTRDYIVYWATGQQLLHHGNPYDAHGMGVLEHAWGVKSGEAFYMRNPPWTLPLAAPLGLMGVHTGAAVWTLFLLALTVAATWIVWPVVRVPGSKVVWIGYFSPLAINAVVAGQTPVFAFLGLALFLRLQKTRPFAAGAGLALCMVKPHLLLACVPAFLLWIVLEKTWRVLLGFVTAMAASCAVTEWIDPAAWRQYLEWARHSGIAHEKIACLSVALRDLIRPSADWLTYIPTAVACVWGLVYYWQRRREWDWTNQGGLAVLVSLFAAPYCFPWDQCLGIPALLFAAARTRSRLALAAIAVAYIGLDVQQLCGIQVRSPFWLWAAPFWLGWFLWARATAKSSESAPVAIAAEAVAVS